MDEDNNITMNNNDTNFTNIYNTDLQVKDRERALPEMAVNPQNNPSNNDNNIQDRFSRFFNRERLGMNRRPLRNRHIGTEPRLGFRDRIFDYLEQRRRDRIERAETRANLESDSIGLRESAINNYSNQATTQNELNIVRRAQSNLEQRRQDLENYRTNIEQERRKFENIDLLLNENQNNTQTNRNANLPDNNTIREFRNEYRRIQRSERTYRTREIANALITGAAIIGIAWSLDRIDPSFISIDNNIQGMQEIAQDAMHTINSTIQSFSNVADTIMNNPTFDNVRNVVLQGPGQLLASSIVGAYYLRRTTRFHRLANEQQFERELMEENNPISVAEDTNNIRHR